MKNCIFNLDGKTAIITGGCGWLGFKMAQILAQYNANVIITSRDLNNALVAITKLDNSSSKQQHYAIELNINDSEEIIDKKFSELVEIYGKIDILINNAVEFTTKDISNISLDEFNQYQKQNGFYFYLSKLVRDLAVKNDLELFHS